VSAELPELASGFLTRMDAQQSISSRSPITLPGPAEDRVSSLDKNSGLALLPLHHATTAGRSEPSRTDALLMSHPRSHFLAISDWAISAACARLRLVP
jgi:hypothetical protein